MSDCGARRRCPRLRAFFSYLFDLERPCGTLPGRSFRTRAASWLRHRQGTAPAARADHDRTRMGPNGMVGARLEHQRARFLPRARRAPDGWLDRMASDRRGSGQGRASVNFLSRSPCPFPIPFFSLSLSISRSLALSEAVDFLCFPQSRARQCSTFLLARAPRSRKSTASQGEREAKEGSNVLAR